MRNLDQYLPGGDVRNPGVYSPQDQTNKGKLATSFDASNLPIKSCETYYAIHFAGFKNFNVIWVANRCHKRHEEASVPLGILLICKL